VTAGALLALALLAAGPAATDAAAVPATVGKVLAEKRYRFCHDPQYPLTEEELGWCKLVPGKNERCPAWHRICAAGARAELLGRQQKVEFEMPALPAIGRTFVWIILIVAAGFLVAILARQALTQRRAPRDKQPGKRPAETGATPAGEDASVETDVFRLLERARAAAAAGDFRRALDESYAALLRKLEGNNLIRVEAHRTNGDYLGDLRQRQPTLRPRVAAVVSAVERVEFGGEPPVEQSYRWVHDRVVALCAERLALWLLVTGAVLGGLTGCKPERENWDDSPSGRGALIEVLKRSGSKSRERLAPLVKLKPADDEGNSEGPDTLVLLPGSVIGAKDWTAVQAWVEAGGTLVVAGGEHEPPKWAGVSFISRDPKAQAGEPLRLGEAAAARLGIHKPVVPAAASSVVASESQPLLSRRRGGRYAIERDHGDGRVVAFADDRLFTNAALLAGDNARFVVALLGEAGPRVEFAGELLGVVAPHPAAAVTRGKLAPALLQLGLLALLFFLYRGSHFGRPHDPVASTRRAFADHVRALGLLYARARAGRTALEHFGAFALERLGERLRLAGHRSLSATAEAVANRTGRPVGEVMRLLLEAKEAATSPSPPPSPAANAEAMVALRALATLLAETAAHPNPQPVSQRISRARAQRGNPTA
jgi:hypothetical protein